MENLKVTVIIPVYNRMEHLRSLFLCLLNQKVQPYEVIIADDGSKENILDYIEDLIIKSKFKIKHVFHEDLGFRKTRILNKAVSVSEGEILIFCDQDIIFGEEYIKSYIEKLEKNKIFMGRARSITKEEREILIKKLEKEKFEVATKFLIEKYYPIARKIFYKDYLRFILGKFKLNKRGLKLVGMSYAMFKDDYLNINGYDEKYRGWGEEDDDFGNRLKVSGKIIKPIFFDTLLYHMWHQEDKSKKKSLNREYYVERKKEIFKTKNGWCEFGYSNGLDMDKIAIKNLK